MFRNVRSRPATRTVAIAAAAVGAMLAAQAPAAPAAQRYLAPAAEHHPAVRHTRQVATYTLTDVGAPTLPQGYSFTAPIGFNNTGQFVGIAGTNQISQCLAFTGKAWVFLAPPATGQCYTTSGISDANAAGVFTTVGLIDPPTNGQIAFYSTVSPTSATMTLFPKNETSALWLDNKSGLAAGYTYYIPVGGTQCSCETAPVTANATATSLSLLQPQCTTAPTGCMYDPLNNGEGAAGVGRFINASGTILGQAQPNINGAGAYIEYKGGKSPTTLQFNLPPDGTHSVEGVYGIDDNGDVAYNEFDSTLNEDLGWVYNPKTKVATNLGTLAGFSCSGWDPLWINGPGRVLGYASGCANDVPNFWWTWDSKHGMVQVSYNLPSLYVNAVTINDKGEISVNLGFPQHWGYLEPPPGF
jgi:hypothetical protein